MHFGKKYAAIALILLLTGCSTQVVNIKDTTTEKNPISTSYEIMLHGNNKTVDAAKLCHGQNNVSRIEIQQDVYTFFADILTLGVYTPRYLSVYCDA